MRDDRGLLEVVLGDGRFLIALTGISLALAGGFAILQSVSGQLLPQDSHAIGLDSAALMRAGNPHLLGFMFHDRVAYGGSLLAIGAGYLWLAAFPMRDRAPWAWWALAFSGGIGFLAFLTYLGQGYLDTWHGVATLFLLPVFVVGLWRARPDRFSLRSVWMAAHRDRGSSARWGRILLGVCAAGLVLAGLTIAIFGMTTVFVPSDLRFIGLDVRALARISPSLIPVISHDRAGIRRRIMLHRFAAALCGPLRGTQPQPGGNCRCHGMRRVRRRDQRPFCRGLHGLLPFAAGVYRILPLSARGRIPVGGMAPECSRCPRLAAASARSLLILAAMPRPRIVWAVDTSKVKGISQTPQRCTCNTTLWATPAFLCPSFVSAP
jgi:hypothetical protein